MVLQIERREGIRRPHDTVVTVLRATLVFRCEDGVWKIAHRHADPITSTRPPTTILRSYDPAARVSITLTRIVGAGPRASQLAVSVLKRPALQI